MKKRKLNKKWHKDTVAAIMNNDSPGKVRFNPQTSVMEIINDNSCSCELGEPCNPRCPCHNHLSSATCSKCDKWNTK